MSGSWFVHFASAGFAGFVAYKVHPWSPGSSLFSWHPTLMSAAVAFLAVEAILMLSNNTLLWSDRRSKVYVHWFLMVLAVLAAISGFIAVYFTKEQYGQPHLATPHAMLGFGTVCYMVMQSLAGTNLIYTGLARRFIDIRVLGRLHGYSGTFLLLLATVTLIGGITTDWFKEHFTGPVWFACLFTPLILYAVILKQVFEPKKKKET